MGQLEKHVGSEREGKRVGRGGGGKGGGACGGCEYPSKSGQFMLRNSSRRPLKAGGEAGQHACLPLMRDNFISSVAGVT